MEIGEYKSFYKTVGSGEGERCNYPTRLDTYGCGCQHNCSYCYARSLLDFRGLWNPANPKEADVEKVRRLIKRRLKPGDVVRLGGMTDCFQPREMERKVTYKTIEALNEAGVEYLIVTKSDLIARDDYLGLMEKGLAHIQVSVTSTDDGISKRIEPGAPLPERRIRAVEILTDKGFDTAVRLSPFIPEFVNIPRINRIACKKIQVEFLRVNGWIERWLDGSGVNLASYSLTEGGYKHLPLADKRILLSRIERPGVAVSVCEDVDSHYAFWRDHYNPNHDDCCNLDRSH